MPDGIDPALVAEAGALGVDVAAACEAGLIEAIRGVRDAARLAESRAAIDEWNGWAGTADLPPG